MIEGVIAISTMLIFLGLIMWTRQAYGMKLDMQQRTRSDTLYFASHACEDTGGGIGQSGGGGTIPGDNPAAGAAGKSGLPDAAAVNRSWNSAAGSINSRAKRRSPRSPRPRREARSAGAGAADATPATGSEDVAGTGQAPT